MTEDEKRRAETALNAARRIGRVRREEQDRIVDEIEQILWEAKEQETADAMIRLARHILDPVRRTP
jgi:hypothetical protein